MGRTLALIKPDALTRGKQGIIIDRILSGGFSITAMKQLRLSKEQVESFYIEHAGKPFYNPLCDFMTSGPIIAMVLDKDNAIEDWRALMGATNPKEAAEGTIRRELAIDIEKNSVHGSDSAKSALREVPFFFTSLEY